MFKQLLKRYFLITTITIIVVVITMVGGINIVNYTRVQIHSKNILVRLIENNGILEVNTPPEPGERPNNKIKEETLGFTKYFSVKFNEDGTVSAFTERAFNITNEKAIEMANNAKSENSIDGYIDYYRYMISEDGNLVVFVGCYERLSEATNFLVSSVIISFVGIVIVMVLSYFFLKRALNPIEESYIKQKSFITDASHELKTPLTIISANNEILEMEYGESESTISINKQIERMNDMVKNLTILARMDEESGKTSFDNINISDIILDSIDNFKSAFQSENKELNFDIDKNIIISGNELQIRHLFSILLENALKYSISYTNISLKKQSSNIIFLINNDAKEVENGDLSKYFERFFRGDFVRASNIEGSGIGLSIAKEISLIHKFHIQAFGNNNTFNIKITI